MVLMGHNVCFTPAALSCTGAPEPPYQVPLDQPASFLLSSPRISGLGFFLFFVFFGSKAGGGCSSHALQAAADSLAGIGVHTVSWFINESTADLPLSQLPAKAPRTPHSSEMS